MTASKWPSNAARRRRLRESRDALLCRSHAQQAVIDSYEGVDNPHELIARLQRVAPCIAAQLTAAANGDDAHSSRLLVEGTVHRSNTAAKHLFGKAVAEYTDHEIRSVQRGHRKPQSLPRAPPESCPQAR